MWVPNIKDRQHRYHIEIMKQTSSNIILALHKIPLYCTPVRVSSNLPYTGCYQQVQRLAVSSQQPPEQQRLQPATITIMVLSTTLFPVLTFVMALQQFTHAWVTPSQTMLAPMSYESMFHSMVRGSQIALSATADGKKKKKRRRKQSPSKSNNFPTGDAVVSKSGQNINIGVESDVDMYDDDDDEEEVDDLLDIAKFKFNVDDVASVGMFHMNFWLLYFIMFFGMISDKKLRIFFSRNSRRHWQQ